MPLTKRKSDAYSFLYSLSCHLLSDRVGKEEEKRIKCKRENKSIISYQRKDIGSEGKINMKSLKPQRIALYPLLVLLFTGSIRAEEPLYPPRVGIKTNLLYWATTTPNLSIEYAFNDHITLDVAGSYNPWRFGSKEENKKIKHWMVQPEVKWWTCEKYNGGFWGLHVHYGRFNAGGIKLPLRIWPGLEDHRYEGYLTGMGVSYGYQWYLSPRWNLEAVFSFGYAYVNYKEYECRLCGEQTGRDHSHYFGPTKVGVSIVYLY